MKRQKLDAAIDADPNIDGDEAREALIYAFLAGAATERELVARGLAEITEAEILKAAPGGYDLARQQSAKLARAAPLADYEEAVRRTIAQPVRR